MADAGVGLVGIGLASGIGAAALVDAVVLRIRVHAWEFPSGAVLSGWLVAMVLSPYEVWYVPTITSVVAIVSKYAFRSGPANMFNPAALAIVRLEQPVADRLAQLHRGNHLVSRDKMGTLVLGRA